MDSSRDNSTQFALFFMYFSFPLACYIPCHLILYDLFTLITNYVASLYIMPPTSYLPLPQVLWKARVKMWTSLNKDCEGVIMFINTSGYYMLKQNKPYSDEES